MLLNSFLYLFLFLPVVACGYYYLRRIKATQLAQGFLLAASLAFYAYAKPAYLPLLVGSIIFNCWAAHRISAQILPGPRKVWLYAGVTLNVLLLAGSKYSGPLLGWIGQALGLGVDLGHFEFPLGISFFTLTQVMFLVDCYQDFAQPVSLFDHATSVAFFPCISSGPITRIAELQPQWHQELPAEDRARQACQGLFLLALGLTKKVVLADTLAQVVNVGWGSVGHLSCTEAWTFSLAYTFQIYFDFSGYTDMAMGSAWLLGIQIPKNFNGPYLAVSISEFWQRWHMSLTHFITNYLYTPILRSFSKATLATSAVATLLAMTIAGAWHGPAWTYVIFGVMHGVALAVNQIWRRRKLPMPRWAGWLVTFLWVNAAFVVFRAPGVTAALDMLDAMLPSGNLLGLATLMTAKPLSATLSLSACALGIAIVFLTRTPSWARAQVLRLNAASIVLTSGLLLFSFLYLNSAAAKTFVYFAF
jgi:alginate O-acetyltransferase complex protein AlgI